MASGTVQLALRFDLVIILTLGHLSSLAIHLNEPLWKNSVPRDVWAPLKSGTHHGAVVAREPPHRGGSLATDSDMPFCCYSVGFSAMLIHYISRNGASSVA
ncbi:hypothetical protein TNCV_2127921 [Trichonephila clavipes]|nr:hypothetical protein TNCV_2127921 [Trichonephila clavipes]